MMGEKTCVNKAANGRTDALPVHTYHVYSATV